MLRVPSVSDPTVSVKLYSWSSQEFREERALVYTSRSNPSHTCISHWRANRQKVHFTLQDCLCEGNPVRIEVEIPTRRNYRGFYEIDGFKIRNSSGKFIYETDAKDLYTRMYHDKFDQREGQLVCYYSSCSNKAGIDFTKCLSEGLHLTYAFNVKCDPSQGIDVNLTGPRRASCESTIAYSCYVEHVRGKPPRNVLEHNSEPKEEEKGNKIVGNGASHTASPSSLSSSTQRNTVTGYCSDDGASRAWLSSSTTESSTILNAGNSMGAFNGAILNGCTLVFVRLTEEVEDYSTFKGVFGWIEK